MICHGCSRDVEPIVSLGESGMERACPRCQARFGAPLTVPLAGDDAAIERVGRTPAPGAESNIGAALRAMAPVVSAAAPPPARHAPPARQAASSQAMSPGDVIGLVRARLAELDVEIARLEGLRTEAKQLRKMLQAAEKVQRDITAAQKIQGLFVPTERVEN